MPYGESIAYRIIRKFSLDMKNNICNATKAARYRESEQKPSFEVWFQVEIARYLMFCNVINRLGTRGTAKYTSHINKEIIDNSEYNPSAVVEKFEDQPQSLYAEIKLISYKREPMHHEGGKRGDFVFLFRIDEVTGDFSARCTRSNFFHYKEIVELKHNSNEQPRLRHNVLYGGHYLQNDGYYDGLESTGILIESTEEDVNVTCLMHHEGYDASSINAFCGIASSPNKRHAYL